MRGRRVRYFSGSVAALELGHAWFAELVAKTIESIVKITMIPMTAEI